MTSINPRILLGVFLVVSCAAVPAAETMSFPELLVLAEEGDARSQALVARAYRLGTTVLQNDDLCLDWAAKSFAQGDAVGSFELAVAYNDGIGITPDETKAQEIFADQIAGIQKLAKSGDRVARSLLGEALRRGWGTEKDPGSAVKLIRQAADAGEPRAQLVLGMMLQAGEGIDADPTAASEWLKRAANQHVSIAEVELGRCFAEGAGVAKSAKEAARWFRRAAYQGNADGQYELGEAFRDGNGIGASSVLAYMWLDLSSRQGHEKATDARDVLISTMSIADQLTGHQWTKQFERRKLLFDASTTGTGFFVTNDGFLVTNHHVVEDAKKILVRIGNQLIPARVVFFDQPHDLAVLKVSGKFSPLPLRKSSSIPVGISVLTLGFPRPEVQGVRPKLTTGQISSLSGIRDDATRYQISVPLQPGNSGGPLVDEHGNVVGIVSARLPEPPWLKKPELLPQSVNYAVKASFLISRLNQHSMIRDKLKPTLPLKPRPLAAVIRDLEAATVLLLVETDEAKVAKSVPRGEFWVGRYAFRGKQVVEIRRDGDFIVAVKVTGDWQFGSKGVISWRGNVRTRQIEGQMRQTLTGPLVWVPGRIDKFEEDRIEISGRVGIFRRRIKYRRPKPREVEELIRKDR
jgi:TPR repeat protein